MAQNWVAVLRSYSRAQEDQVDRRGFEKKDDDPEMDLEKGARTRGKECMGLEACASLPPGVSQKAEVERAREALPWRTGAALSTGLAGEVTFVFRKSETYKVS